MFRGHRAWFSQSVSPGPRELWAAGGGVLAPWRDADYLFSSDASHPDTRRIHESLDYLEGRATVFHSQYLSAGESTSMGAKLSVVLGHFVLPPACMQEEIRRKIGRFIWEQAEESQPSDTLGAEPEAVRKGSEEEAEEGVRDLAESSEEENGSRTPSQEEFLYHALREYPMNNMVTGYASARDLKQYRGELRDFTPGSSGYAAYFVRKEISLCYDGKGRTRRGR
ncbi:telomere repeats-binding bouquet formation protein 2 [Indicator indicator]|uniref:telomere repeats-binding bouquet formation protein 2 n=1 Tax=Indicator indicator TaxID=1002788 RepID=UPI0023DF0E6D|nr:telomere repeats-binding bouquet formation protein 2 [Indicator indicator]